MANKGNALLDGTSGAVPIASGGTNSTTQTIAFNALSPATTKGDLIIFNGTNNIRVAAGTDGQALVVDSTTASGLKWDTVSSSSSPIKSQVIFSRSYVTPVLTMDSGIKFV